MDWNRGAEMVTRVEVQSTCNEGAIRKQAGGACFEVGGTCPPLRPPRFIWFESPETGGSRGR